MELSARNQLPGKVVTISLGGVMAEVTIDIGGGNTVVAAVTRASVEAMGLKQGDDIVAVIKATEVMVGKRS
jgi:molybdopterin-binding protein